jgi:mannosylglycerate hydrolase
LSKAYNTPIQVYTYGEFLNGRLIFSQREIEGTRPVTNSLFELDGWLVVSAIKMAEKGTGIVIRLFNGKDHEILGDEIRFHYDISEAYYTNLLEEKIESIDIKNNTIKVKQLSHCKFATIYVR